MAIRYIRFDIAQARTRLLYLRFLDGHERSHWRPAPLPAARVSRAGSANPLAQALASVVIPPTPPIL